MAESWSVVEVPALRSDPADFDMAATALTSTLDDCEISADAFDAMGLTGWDGFEGEAATALGVVIQSLGIAMHTLPNTARPMATALAAAAAELLALETRSDQLLADAAAQWPIFTAARTDLEHAEADLGSAINARDRAHPSDLANRELVVSDRTSQRNTARTARNTERRKLDDFQKEHDDIRNEEDDIHFDVAAAEWAIRFDLPTAAPGVNAVFGSDGSIEELFDDLLTGDLHDTRRQAILDAQSDLADFIGRDAGTSTGTDEQLLTAATDALAAARLDADNGGATATPTVEVGTSGNDVIVVTQLTDGRLVVTTNGSSRTLTVDESTNLVIDSGAGNDRITIDSNVTHGVTVVAGSGNDTIVGGSGADTIDGGTGADTIDGGNGDDLLRGDRGADTIAGGGGNDLVDGGAGDDTVSGGPVAATPGPVGAGAGHDERDRINAGVGDDTVDGGFGDDIIHSGSGADTVTGGDGDDAITAGNGNDVVTGDGGRDTIDGGDGVDKVYGGDGNDTVGGGDGNDFIEGGSGNDTLGGDHGNDNVYGGAGDDRIDGNAGDDALLGGDGDDDVRGGDGDDLVAGAGGDDRLHGGRGDDVFATGSGDDSVFADGANDSDTVYAESGDHVQVRTADEVERRDVDLDISSGDGDDGRIVIDSKGDPEFDERVRTDLEVLAQTPEGRELLESIIDSGRTVTIIDNADDGSFASVPSDGYRNADGTPGDGGDSRVKYSTDNRWGAPGSVLTDSPPVVILAHELVHADDAVNGTAEVGTAMEYDVDGFPTGDTTNRLELDAVGLPFDGLGGQPHPGSPSENSIRDDLGQAPRPEY